MNTRLIGKLYVFQTFRNEYKWFIYFNGSTITGDINYKREGMARLAARKFKCKYMPSVKLEEI